jgi:hypothetical protein
MAAEADLPGIGKVKKGWVWAGMGAVALIVGIAYWKHRQNAGAAASSSATAPASAIDPETGFPEGSPQDLSALQALQGGVYSDTGDTGSGAAGELYYDPADGLYDLTSPYDTASATSPNSGPGTFTTDAAWVQYAIENVTGYSASDVQNALALYLASQPLTTTQMSIYQAALAVAGSPPAPPSTPATLQSGGSTTTTTTSSASTSKAAGPISNLQAYSVTKTGFTAKWNPASGATGGYSYEVKELDGTVVKKATTTSTGFSVSGLHSGWTYNVGVQGLPGGPGDNIHVALP